MDHKPLEKNMKQKSRVCSWLRFAAAGLLLTGSIAVSQAQANYVVTTWDTDDPNPLPWHKWWGEPEWTAEHDLSVNAITKLAPNNAGSGSMKNTLVWPSPSYQYMMRRSLHGNEWDGSVWISGLDYTNLTFDIRFDPASAKTTAGDYGHLVAGVTVDRGTDHNWDTVTLWDVVAFPATNGWVHVEARIDPSIPGIDKINGIFVNYPWQPNALVGQQVFWLDNIIFGYNTNKYIPPPTLSPVVPTGPAGLQITSLVPGENWPRQNIATPSGSYDYTWIGQGATPVTYAFTLLSFPDAKAHPGFEAHMNLVDYETLPADAVAWTETYSAIDWNSSNAVVITLLNDANGGVNYAFQYKVDHNAAITNTVAVAHGDTAIGTWALTFVNDTNVTMTGPGGVSTNFILDPFVAQHFGGRMLLHFGTTKNGTVNNDATAVFSRIKVTHPVSPIDDTFPGPALNDPNNPVGWRLAAADPNGIVAIPTGSAYWLSWTLPDLGFSSIQTNSSLAPEGWGDAPTTTVVTLAGYRKALLPTTSVPAGGAAYFRMVKRPFVKLQVLMPGETAAPGTPTGKTGTPDIQTAGSPVAVIVNAVDDSWHPITYATDTVTITSDDPAFGPPTDAALVNGTRTFNVFFGTPGSFKVTATDVTDATKTAGTGSPTTIQ
jgi:hypothetical protein